MKTPATPPRVLVLGATGMLGAMVADVLAREEDLALTLAARNPARPGIEGPSSRVRCLPFDAERDDDPLPALLAEGFDWIINAIGIIKPHIQDADPAATERATRVNALFPHRLARAAQAQGARVLQIATDCVYSGREGAYAEDAPHDALDVYGKSKSLGEVPAPSMHHLRCSIIGPEVTGHRSLLDWFRNQPPGARLTGFTNHLWNGVTTLHYARLCRGVIRSNLALPQRQHVLPSGRVTKAEMLQVFAERFGRTDLAITQGEAPVVVDRTLATQRPETNAALWAAAGYPAPPTFDAMMRELADYPFNRKETP